MPEKSLNLAVETCCNRLKNDYSTDLKKIERIMPKRFFLIWKLQGVFEKLKKFYYQPVSV